MAQPSTDHTVATPWRHLLTSAVATLTTPLLPTDFLDLLDPMRSGADLRGRVVQVRPEGADAATVTIRPGRGWRGHRPGQYVRIGIDIDGVRHWRAYSLTSPPGHGDAREGTITITVKGIPEGLVSQHIVRRLQPGTTLMLDQATGDFTLPAKLPPKLLFLTAGSGITPVVGMLRSLSEEDTNGVDIQHLHLAPTRSAVLFGDEIEGRSDCGYRFALRLDDEHGVMDLRRDLAATVPDWAERATWACGPLSLLDAAQDLWESADAQALLHTERFRAALRATGSGGRIRFGDQGNETEADGDTTILDAAQRAGVILPSGCRMGICFGCVLPLREGAVTDLRTGETTMAARGDDVRIQTCVSAVAGMAHLDC